MDSENKKSTTEAIPRDTIFRKEPSPVQSTGCATQADQPRPARDILFQRIRNRQDEHFRQVAKLEGLKEKIYGATYRELELVLAILDMDGAL